MNNMKKLLIVIACGGAVWGLSYAGSIWSTYSFVTSSLCAAITALCGILTGYPKQEA